MSLGRKPQNISTPNISTPVPVTQYQYTSPTGNAYWVNRNGDMETSQSNLSPQTQSTISTSQNALQSLASSLNQTDPQMLQDIGQKSQNFYDLQAQNINNEANALNRQTQSDLAQRFGGAYNSTFGATLLGQQNKNRLNQLYNAGLDATAYGQNLYNQDQQNQIQRFQTFGNYLNDQNNQAQSINNYGSGLLQNEAGRAQSLGIVRAQIAQGGQIANQNAALQVRQQQLSLINSIISGGSQLGSSYVRSGGM